MKPVIKVEGLDAFFKRGRKIAELADRGKLTPRKPILSFEDREDMERYLRDGEGKMIEPSQGAGPK